MIEFFKNLLRPSFHFIWSLKNKFSNALGRRSKHIVICGYPRSGTSLIYNMISSFITDFRCEEFEVQATERLHRHGNIVTKFPLDILSLQFIIEHNSFNKNIFFIVITRDIRDILTSRHPNIPNEYFISYNNSWWPQDTNFNEWKNDAPGIKDIYNALQKSRHIENITLLEVPYEKIISDTFYVQQQIEKLTNVKFSGNFSDFYQHSEKHAYKYSGEYQAKDESLVRESKKIDNSRVAKWRKPEHLARIYEQFTSHPELFNILIQTGYEKNNDWFDEIKSAMSEIT